MLTYADVCLAAHCVGERSPSTLDISFEQTKNSLHSAYDVVEYIKLRVTLWDGLELNESCVIPTYTHTWPDVIVHPFKVSTSGRKLAKSYSKGKLQVLRSILNTL